VVELLLADYVDTERERIVASLLDWLRIPSISAQPDHAGDVRRSAEFTAQPFRNTGLEHVEVLATDGAPTAVDHPALAALRRAIARVWGKDPLLTREGGSGPEEALGRVFDAPLLFLGVGLPVTVFTHPTNGW
jgi:acetylornithine deacetylase/succinyl-diaminopimelate desuccinylase-like protein